MKLKPYAKPKVKTKKVSVNRSRNMLVLLLIVIVVAGAGFLYKRHRDNSGGGSIKAPKLISADFCGLSGVLDGYLSGAGVPPGGVAPATVKKDDIARVVSEMGTRFDDLDKAAPSGISGDVKTVVSAVKQAGDGNTTALTSTAFRNARDKIAQQTAVGCQHGDNGGSGSEGA